MWHRRRDSEVEDSWDSSSAHDHWLADGDAEDPAERCVDWSEHCLDEDSDGHGHNIAEKQSRTAAWAAALARWREGSPPRTRPGRGAEGTPSKAYFVPADGEAAGGGAQSAARRLAGSSWRALRHLLRALWPFPHRRVGPYLVGKRIGYSRTGRTYAALHTESGRSFAIKRLIRGLCYRSAPGRACVFEAGQVSSCGVDGVVSIKQLAVKGGQTYLVLSQPPGGTLATLLASETRMWPRPARRLALSLCDVLAALHERGLVHGLLMPEHVLVHGDGGSEQICLSDFGLPAALAALPTANRPRWVRALLRSGFVAPEVRGGANARESADVFGLGALLFAMLAGRAPRTPKKERLPQHVPAETQRFVLSCLCPDPRQRPESIKAARRTLLSLAPEFRDMERLLLRQRRRRAARWIAMLAMILIAGRGALSLSWCSDLRQEARRSLVATLHHGRAVMRGRSAGFCAQVYRRRLVAWERSRTRQHDIAQAGALEMLARACHVLDGTSGRDSPGGSRAPSPRMPWR